MNSFIPKRSAEYFVLLAKGGEGFRNLKSRLGVGYTPAAAAGTLFLILVFILQ
jgi:hypothetical protein